MHTNRGVGAPVCIMEEAGFISERLWTEVVIPTMLGGTRVLGISSMPSTDSPFLVELMETRDDRGKLVLNTINMEMVCERCKQRKQEMKCTHKLAERPAHQDPRRYRSVRALLGSGDRRDTFRTEVMGLPTNSSHLPAFEHKQLDLLRGSPDWEYRGDAYKPISHIFISVDPAAGGAASDSAITSGFLVDNTMIMCGAELHHSEERENITAVEVLVAHTEEVRRRIPGAQNAKALVIVESNMGTEAQWFQKWVRTMYPMFYQNCLFLTEDTNDLTGFRSTQRIKHTMVMSFVDRLTTRPRGPRGHGAVAPKPSPGVLRYHDFITMTPGMDGDSMFEKVITQFKGFTRFSSKAQADEAGKHVTFTYNGKGGRGKDDLVMSFLFTSFMMIRFYTSDKYARARVTAH